MPNSDRFDIPGSLQIERSLRREGPSPVYVAWIPNRSRMFYEQKKLLQFCKWPATTTSGQALREWLNGFDDSPAQAAAKVQEIKLEGWGPESFDREEPNDQTKMVT